MSEATISDEDKKRLFGALDELRRLTNMQTDMLRVVVHHKCDKAVSRVLPSESERLAYGSSDGNRASRDVGERAGVSHTTIKRWWKKWVDKGMGEHVPAARGSGQSFKARYTFLELAVAVLEGEVEPD
jgi:hypothetical protein